MKISLTKLFLLTAVVGALACVASSFAGPMPQEKNMTPIAPAPVCDWSGFYVGLNAGVTNYTARFDDRDDFFDIGAEEYDTAAFIGGGQIGYNFQMNQLVLGLEVDASGLPNAEINKSSSLEYWYDHANVDFLATARLRMGVAVDKALIYVSGGGAYAHGKWDTEYFYTPGYTYNVFWNGNDWRWGWSGGAGIEYMLNCHWSIRAEALYTWLQDDTVHGRDPQYLPYERYRMTYDDDLWSYRVGVNFKFGGFGH